MAYKTGSPVIWESLRGIFSHSLENSKSYDKIKRAIFERFGLNPLEYRDKFRGSKQLPDETFKEYAIRITRYFDHWKDSEDVQRDYDKLADMIIRDQLISNCNLDLQTYLQEKEPKSVADLVALANAYQLAHKNRDNRKQLYRPPILRFQNKENLQSYENMSANKPMFKYQNRDNSQAYETMSGSQGGTYQSSKSFEKRKCFVCQSEDHLIATCPFKQNTNSEKQEVFNRKEKDKQANGLLHSPTKLEANYNTIEIPVERQNL